MNTFHRCRESLMLLVFFEVLSAISAKSQGQNIQGALRNFILAQISVSYFFQAFRL